MPYGTRITEQTLGQVEAAENLLHDLGFRQLRVRHHGDTARIEAAPAEFGRILDPELRRRITAELRRLGYRFVTLDLDGYRTGSLNPQPA